MEGPLWMETLGRSLGSHDATEPVGGMCHGNACREETTRLHAISCTKTGWSSLTHNRMLHQALAQSLRESKVQFVVEDTWPFRQRASEQNGRLNPLRMDITTEAGALFDNHPRLKDKALLLDITIVNPCAGSNLGNAVRHVGKHLADAVERKKNKYRGSFPATYSLLPLAMSTCGEVGSDVHALIKELAIRRVQHRSETYSNESQHLAEGTEVPRLRRRFSFVLQQALSFCTRHHLCRQGVALASTRQPHSQGPASVQAHRTGGVTGSEGQEGANGVGGGIGVGGGNGDGNGDGDGAEPGTGVEVNEGVQDGNEDGSGDRVGTRRRTPYGNGDGNGDGTEFGPAKQVRSSRPAALDRSFSTHTIQYNTQAGSGVCVCVCVCIYCERSELLIWQVHQFELGCIKLRTPYRYKVHPKLYSDWSICTVFYGFLRIVHCWTKVCS